MQVTANDKTSKDNAQGEIKSGKKLSKMQIYGDLSLYYQPKSLVKQRGLGKAR